MSRFINIEVKPDSGSESDSDTNYKINGKIRI